MLSVLNFENDTMKIFILIGVLFMALPVMARAQDLSTAADCLILPHRVTKLSAPVMGVIDQVAVKKGDRVERGQTVATLESSVEQAAVALAQIRAQITSEIQEGEVNTAYDQKRKVRMDSLFKQKNISEDVRDEFERDERLAAARLQQARDMKNVREFELKGAQARLAQKTIRAPFDGFILDVMKQPGEFVEEQPIVTIAQLDPLNVEAILPIEHFGKIKPGMSADVRLEAFPDKKLAALVHLVDPVGNAASGTFGIRLELPNPGNKIPAGMKCQTKFGP